MRAGLPKREPLWLEQWEQSDLYRQLRAGQQGRPEFILHDGPPFANGDAHMGHALNMTLKDIVLKSKNMSGYSVPFIPGWDCHGLPIEHKVMKDLGKSADEMPEAIEIRKECQAMAEKYIDIQRKQFKRLGVFGEWDKPYITMEPEYEADVLRVFSKIVDKGLVFQALKPVFWSTGCRTALAEAEVEYADRTDVAVYVKFPLTAAGAKTLGIEGDASLLIWTTTPWTLPANLAVAMHKDLEYVLVDTPKGAVLIAAARQQALEKLTETTYSVQRTFKGSELEGVTYQHPFLEREGVVHPADFVTSESGTGLVHIAPGHGNDDYVLGQKVGLDILSPVDDAGHLTDECGVPEWSGMYVFKANKVIAQDLDEKGFILASENYVHSYPHCWRSKTPIVFRSVTQWFIRVDDFRQQALDAIGQVEWIPNWGENRIRGAVETRPDWCISRQRTWGIPIPAFFDAAGDPQLNADTIRKFADLVAKEGTNVWFSSSDEELCKKLGLPAGWRKGFDTLDVWIDSGSSHAAVTRKRLNFPADLYLEGSDQHRGWFQSSLSTSVAISGEAPFKAVLTNGFVVDQDKKKLSKSSGKPVGLMQFVDQYGSDILRLWVSSEDYRNDVPFSEEIFKHVSDAYRSMRNSFRILLANLQDYDHACDAVEIKQLSGIDLAVYAQLQELIRQVRGAYDRYEFHQVYHLINRFCAVELSALYVDVTKDRMYCDAISSPRRRATQTVMHEILDALSLLLAPVMPYTCEEAWQYALSTDDKGADAEGKLLRDSIHLAQFPEANALSLPDGFMASWDACLTLRGDVNEKLEALRRDKKIGKSLEAVVVLPEARRGLLDENALAELLIVSGIEYDSNVTEISVVPAAERGWVKCPRCWAYHPADQIGTNSDHPELCPRCTEAVTQSIA